MRTEKKKKMKKWGSRRKNPGSSIPLDTTSYISEFRPTVMFGVLGHI